MAGSQEHFDGVVEAPVFGSAQTSGERIVNDAYVVEWLRDNFRTRSGFQGTGRDARRPVRALLLERL
jgi:hypothetical protein